MVQYSSEMREVEQKIERANCGMLRSDCNSPMSAVPSLQFTYHQSQLCDHESQQYVHLNLLGPVTNDFSRFFIQFASILYTCAIMSIGWGMLFSLALDSKHWQTVLRINLQLFIFKHNVCYIHCHISMYKLVVYFML